MAISVPPAEHIEAELRSIRGVIAVRVVTSTTEITEIHVLASTVRPVKQVVRDVESVCAARFRLEIDHRRISVAQIDAVPENEALPRPKLQSVRLESNGEEVSVAVQLAFGNELYSGEAQGLAFSANRIRLAGLATIRALDAYLEGTLTLELNDIEEFDMAGQSGYSAVVTVLSRLGEEKLIGCALTQNDHPEACVRAVLDALNRRVVQQAVGRKFKNAPL